MRWTRMDVTTRIDPEVAAGLAAVGPELDAVAPSMDWVLAARQAPPIMQEWVYTPNGPPGVVREERLIAPGDGVPDLPVRIYRANIRFLRFDLVTNPSRD